MAIRRNKPGIRAPMLRGGKGLDQALGRLEVGMRGKPLKRAVKKAAAPVAKEMRKRAPRNMTGGGVKTPRATHKAITTRTREYENATVAITGPRLFASPNPYWLEYGTDPHLISPAGHKGAVGRLRVGQKWVSGAIEHPGAKPHPFVRPAYDAKVGESKRIMRKELGGEIARLLKSG